jgi:hypothetical protein
VTSTLPSGCAAATSTTAHERAQRRGGVESVLQVVTKIAVAGATGRVGTRRASRRRREARGYDVVPMSRSNGVDVITADGPSSSVGGRRPHHRHRHRAFGRGGRCEGVLHHRGPQPAGSRRAGRRAADRRRLDHWLRPLQRRVERGEACSRAGDIRGEVHAHVFPGNPLSPARDGDLLPSQGSVYAGRGLPPKRASLPQLVLSLGQKVLKAPLRPGFLWPRLGTEDVSASVCQHHVSTSTVPSPAWLIRAIRSSRCIALSNSSHRRSE